MAAVRPPEIPEQDHPTVRIMSQLTGLHLCLSILHLLLALLAGCLPGVNLGLALLHAAVAIGLTRWRRNFVRRTAERARARATETDGQDDPRRG